MANKENAINQKWISIFSQPVNYTLLAELHHLRLIIMPNYKLVLARCNHELTGQDFRKKIKETIANANDSKYIDSLITRKNGMMVKCHLYCCSIKKIKDK